MKKFALVLPTRDREQKFNGFIRSVQATCKYKSDIDIHVMCDEDDTSSQNYVSRAIASNANLSIYLHTRQRTDFINKDYYNVLAEKADASLIWILADDLEMTQMDWDVRIFSAFLTYTLNKPDKICCISAKDNTPVPSSRMQKFPCFPIFSKEAMHFFGWALHPQPPTWGTDYITYLIYKGAERLLELHETNYLNHISVHTHQCEEDHISLRIGNIFNRLKMRPEYNTDKIIAEQVPGLIEKLKQHIGVK